MAGGQGQVESCSLAIVRTALQAWRLRQFLKEYRPPPLTPDSFFLQNSSCFWLCLVTQLFFFLTAFSEFWGQCLQTLLLCLRPALGLSFVPLLFSSQSGKNENTAPRAPTSRRLCQLTSGHGMEQLPAGCTPRPRPAPHSSLSPLRRRPSPECRGRTPAPQTAKANWVPPHQKW